MDNIESTKPTQINLNDLNASQSMDLLFQLVNRANKTGAFTIDESYTIKILFEIIGKELSKTQTS